MTTDSEVCGTCGTVLPSRGWYCPHCASQTRCKSCDELLEPGANACVMCGAELSTEGPASKSNGARSAERRMSSIRLEEGIDRRSLEARLTDEAVESLSAPLGAFLMYRSGVSGSLRSFDDDEPYAEARHKPPAPLSPPSHQPPLAGDSQASDEKRQSGRSNDERSRLNELFRQYGDKWRLYESRLKAKSNRDFTRRLTYLYLLLKSHLGEDSTPKVEVVDVIKDAGAFDRNNTHKVFDRTDELMVDGDSVSLRLGGRESASKFLDEVFDENISDAWTVGSKLRSAPKPNKGRSTEASRSSTKRSRSSHSRKVEKFVNSWKQLGLQINGHGLLKGRGALDRSIFALWAIRKAVGDDEGKVVSNYHLSQFIREAFQHRVSREAISSALRSDAAHNLVIPESATKFQITPTGMEYAEAMLSTSSASSGKSNTQ